VKWQANQRIEPMTSSAVRLTPNSGAGCSLLVMAHPQRWAPQLFTYV